jgi:predicted nucleic-acid-binding protein
MAITVAVDTNVLARAVLRDDEVQYQAVWRRFAAVAEAGDEILVPLVVIVELVWVIQESYEFGREQTIEVLRRLLGLPLLRVAHRASVERATDWYEAGPAEFADYLILATSLGEGAETLHTFDRNLLKHPRAKRP